jgi:hypothetical protein
LKECGRKLEMVNKILKITTYLKAIGHMRMWLECGVFDEVLDHATIALRLLFGSTKNQEGKDLKSEF